MSGRRGPGRNLRVALPLVGAVLGMIGLAYASVPLYRLFCQVTGYGGTPQVAGTPAERVVDRVVTVRFDASVDPQLPWSFAPAQRAVSLRAGEQGLTFYRAENRGREPVVGTATFNVTPLKAGQYFNKIECFCFTEQRLDPGETAELPVTFFVDPRIADDRSLDDVSTITLSYTFFRAPEQPEPARTAGAGS